ncbi:hypothetical protein PCURB6_02480 [Paenibacillus curdlanolyticus]|nr:hypothetical protein PCURB6_02480 [Paenibacillus curdlanolyticus]
MSFYVEFLTLLIFYTQTGDDYASGFSVTMQTEAYASDAPFHLDSFKRPADSHIHHCSIL